MVLPMSPPAVPRLLAANWECPHCRTKNEADVTVTSTPRFDRGGVPPGAFRLVMVGQCRRCDGFLIEHVQIYESERDAELLATLHPSPHDA